MFSAICFAHCNGSKPLFSLSTISYDPLDFSSIVQKASLTKSSFFAIIIISSAYTQICYDLFWSYLLELYAEQCWTVLLIGHHLIWLQKNVEWITHWSTYLEFCWRIFKGHSYQQIYHFIMQEHLYLGPPLDNSNNMTED